MTTPTTSHLDDKLVADIQQPIEKERTTTQTTEYKIGNRVQMYVTEYPKWWQFWKKPVRVMREFICRGAP